MSRPVVLISSTYVDLRQERENIASFLENIGYEVKLHEKGDIPYGISYPLDTYIYEDINTIDFLVGIIGGRYGSESSVDNRSVTQSEIINAIEKNKKVFIFIQNDVHYEYSTYLKNKNNKRIKYNSVDSIEIFKFIEYLYGIRNNNYIYPYSSIEEIKRILSAQLLGIFKKLLTEREDRSTLYEGSKFTVFRSRERMIDYFNKIMGKAKDGDVLWAQGIGHTAYPKSFPERLEKLLNNNVEIRFIANKKSPHYEEFTSILKTIPGVEWYPSMSNKIRVFGLSNYCVIVALPNPEKYEAILIKDESLTNILFEWFNEKFNQLRTGFQDGNSHV